MRLEYLVRAGRLEVARGLAPNLPAVLSSNESADPENDR